MIMNIPDTLYSPSYYIAISETDALSNWSSFDKAMDCMALFKKHRPHELSKIKGIIKVDQNGKKYVFIPAKLK